MLKKIIYLFILTLSIILIGCSNDEKNSQNSDKLQVYTTIFPIKDIVSKIGGDKVDVYLLSSNNSDIHSFEPTAKDIANLENSDLLFYNGAGLEEWIDSIKNSISSKKLSFVDLSENIKLIEPNIKTIFETESLEEVDNHSHEHDHSKDHDHTHEHNHFHEYDPHIWLSPSNVITQSSVILQSLIEKDPENQNYYNENYIEVLSKLEALNTDYLNNLSNVNKSEIVVTHPAYTYMLYDFSITQVPISLNTESLDASPAKLLEIIDYINKNSVKYIIIDSNSSQKIVENIKEETGVEILTLNTMEYISEEEVLNNEDYFSIMYKNLEVLKTALS